MTLATAPLTTEQLSEAAVLHDRWYGKVRRSLPYPSGGRTAPPPSGEELLGKILTEPRTEAACARTAGGALAGYLAAVPVDAAPQERAALDCPPRAALVPFGGYAVPGTGAGAAALRELYAVVADRLVGLQRLVHDVDLPADDLAAFAWCRLGFGLERITGVMPVKARGRQPRGVEALSIRRAGPGDLDRIGRMAVEAARQRTRSAVFLPQPESALATLRTHYAGALRDPRSAAWLAARRGEEVGMIALVPAEPGPLAPEACAELAEAYTAPAARGEGVSRVLLATALAWAYDNGYRYVTACWDAASPLTAGHWPAIGFKPIAYRMRRVLDPRVSAEA
jgi:GNAT superfamily N-acetyltransferase